MSEYNKAVNPNAKVLDHVSKDYHDGHNYIPSSIQGNQINQDQNQVNQDNPVKIKVQTFKQTEIGVIPEDWEVASIDNVSYVDPDNLTSSTNPEYNFNYISLEDVDNGILKSFSELNFKDAPSRARRKIKINDVLISTVRPNLKSHLHIRGDVKDWICSTGFAVLRCKNNIANSEFLFNHFFAFIINKQIDNLITGSNYPAISNKEVKSLKIPLPPLPEQKAIAQVLSDTDSLIQAITQKLAKKRAIKQGAMQQLLTPKEDWEIEKLPSVCWFQEGPGLRNWQFTKKGMKVINVTNLVGGYLNLDKTDRHISLKEFEVMYKHFEIDENDIVMASSGNSYSKVAVVRKQDLPLLMNTSVIRFKPLKGLVYNYLLIFLKSKSFKDQIDLLITGGAQPNFGPFHLNKIEIPIPFTEEEQTRIATILSDMDTEIEQIEQKLSKYKLLKQGLMQQLLTGKIRLV